MAAIKPLLYLTTDDPYKVYGPGDKVSGTAHLEVVNPLLAKYVVISLRAGSRINVAGDLPAKQSFFYQDFKVPYQNKREDPAKILLVGQHKWSFDFKLPQANTLPPSFLFRDQHGSAEILYCLVMCVFRPNITTPTKDSMCGLPLKYSPRRSSSFTVDESLSTICQPLLAKRRGEAELYGQKSRHMTGLFGKILSRSKPVEEQFHVTLWLPQHAVFSEHLNVSLKVQTDDEDPLRFVQVRMTKIEYRVWALTTTMHGQASRTRRHKIQSNVCSCSSLLETNSHWTSLRRHAPFRIQPRMHGLPLGKDGFSSLTPSFGSQNIIRQYRLDIDVYLSIYDRVHRVRFEGNELILLPHEIHLENERRDET